MAEAAHTLERFETANGTTVLRSGWTPSGTRYEVVVAGRVAMAACDSFSERAAANSVLEGGVPAIYSAVRSRAEP